MDHLDEVADNAKGQVVLFQWVEYLKEAWDVLQERHQQSGNQGQVSAASTVSSADELDDSSGNRKDQGDHAATAEELLELAIQSATPRQQPQSGKVDANRSNNNNTPCPPIASGDPYTERKSLFIAHVAPIQSESQVAQVRDELLQNRKIAAATHNIMAYRIYRPATQSFTQDCDDDGMFERVGGGGD